MKKSCVVVVFIGMLGLAGGLLAQEESLTYEQVQQAHKDLQEALSKIKTYHQTSGSGEWRFPFHSSHNELLMEVGRPRLGILVQSSFDEDGEHVGAVIMAVTPGGPAAEAGLEAGDVITAVGGVELVEQHGRPHDVLIREMLRHHDGDAVTVDYLRDGTAGSTTVHLRALEIEEFVFEPQLERLIEPDVRFYDGRSGPDFDWYFPHGWLDMELVSLNPELGEYFGTDDGVLVIRGPDSDELGLEGGDVIVSIDGRAVTSPTHAMRILRSYEPEESMEIEIYRHGRRESIVASVPEHRVPILEERWDGR
jgi:C-terminal processing protease CtpA/Prc